MASRVGMVGAAVAAALLGVGCTSITREECTAQVLGDGPGGRSLAAERAALQGVLLEARVDQAEAEARLLQLRGLLEGGRRDATGEILASQTVAALSGRRVEVGRRLAELELRYAPTHPSVFAIRAELADIEAQIDAELARIAAVLELRAETARRRTESLLVAIDALERCDTLRP